MTKPRISIIVAQSRNRVIGKENKLLWHIPEDMQRFKKLTIGHPIIMGRKTFDSLGRPLPNRINIIVTRNKDFSAAGCIITNSLEEALRSASRNEQDEIFIIGGADIYRQAMPLADRLYITEIDLEIEGDAFFPSYEYIFTKKISEESGTSGILKYKFFVFER